MLIEYLKIVFLPRDYYITVKKKILGCTKFSSLYAILDNKAVQLITKFNNNPGRCNSTDIANIKAWA